MIKKTIYILIGISLLAGFVWLGKPISKEKVILGGQISVPSAPNAGKLLQSVSTGNWGLASLTAGSNITISTTTTNITISSTASGASPVYPFTTQSYGASTSTTIGFLQGMFSNSSTTLNDAVYLPFLSAGQVNVGSAGKLYSGATTTFSGGLTYLNGNVTCTGCSGTPIPNLTYLTLSGTAYYTASTTLTDNKSFYFRNGFVSNASSTFSATTLFPSLTKGFAGIDSTGLLYTFATSTIKTSQITNDSGFVTSSGVTSVTATPPIFSSGGATPNITWTGLATTSQPSSSNLLTSNGGAGVYGTATSTLSPTSPLGGSFTQVGSGGSITCTTAASGVAGCLSNTSFDTFNNKENALTFSFPLSRAVNAISFVGLGTTTNLTNGQVVYATGVNTVSSVATGTITGSTGISLDNSTRSAIGGSVQITNTGVISGLCSGGTTCSGTNPLTISSFAFPFTVNTGYNSTTTAIGFTGANSLFATGSTTFSGALHIPTILSSFLSTDSLGNVYGAATSSIKGSQITNDSGWTSNTGTVTSVTAGAGHVNNGTAITTTGTIIGAIATSATPSLGGLGYWTGVGTTLLPASLGTVATTSVTCTGSATCTAFTVIGASPITINSTGGGTGSSKWATSTDGYAIYPTGTSFVAVGTTTSRLYPLVAASSTVPQLAFGDGLAGDPLWTFRNAGGDLFIGTTTVQGLATSSTAAITIRNSGKTGLSIGSTTPFASFSFNPFGGQFSNQFAIGSSSGTSFIIDNTGNTGIATSVPASLFSINNVANFRVGTTTFYSPTGGINITGGCFSINGTCVGGGSGGTGTVTSITNGTGLVNQGTSYTTTGTITSAFASGTTPTIGRLAMFGSTGSGSTSIFLTDVATSSVTCNGTASCGTTSYVLGSALTITGLGLSTYDAFTHPTATQSATTTLMRFDGQASTTQLSVYNKAYFGSTATSTFDTTGNLVIPSGSSFTNTGRSDGCATWATAVLTSTGVACGSGGGGIADPFTHPLAGQSATTSLMIFNGNGFYVGTTTDGVALATFASSTVPQLSLGDGLAGDLQWTMRSAGGDLFISSTTVQGVATTSTAALTIKGNGKPAIAVSSSTPNAQLTIETRAGDYNNVMFVGSSTELFRIDNSGGIYAPNTGSSGATQTGYWCYDARGQFIRDSAVCLVSALKFKKDIKPLDVGLNDLMALTPVSYLKKDPLDESDSHKQMGFIADNTPDSLKEMLVTYDENGDVRGFRYEQLTSLIVKSIQELAQAKGVVRRNVEENWQDILIGLFILYVIYNEYDKRKRK